MIREWTAEINRILNEEPADSSDFPPYPMQPHPDESFDDYLDRWFAQIAEEGLVPDRHSVGDMVIALTHNADAMDGEVGPYGAAFLSPEKYDLIRESISEIEGMADRTRHLSAVLDDLLDPPIKVRATEP